MAEWKQKEAALDADPTEALPPYSVEDDSRSVAVAGSSTQSNTGRQDGAGATPATAPASSGLAPSGSIIESKASLAAAERARSNPSTNVPTAAAPFNFPSDATLPPYSPADEGAGVDGTSTSSAARHLPIILPQVRPKADSPLLAAYSQDLLRYGIPKDTWLSFVDTLSAFLTANVSEKAISHAADIGRQLGDVPTDLGRSVADSAKHVGRDIKRSAMKGNLFGMAANIVGGAIGLTVGTSLKLAASATALPGKAAMAVMTPPQTPRERAAAYASVANGKWLSQRGLKAQILDSQQVAELLGITMDDLLLDTQAARAAAEQRAAAKQLNASIIDSKRADSGSTMKEPLSHLQGSVADLEAFPAEDAALSPTTSAKTSKSSASTAKNASKQLEELGQTTIWLVVTQEKDKGVQEAGQTRDDNLSASGDRDREDQDYGSRGNRGGRKDRDRRRRRRSISKD